MTFGEIYNQVKEIEGWMPDVDCKFLYEYTKDMEGLIVEIGSYMGKSTKMMALSAPKSKIVAIDSYPYRFKKAKPRFLELIKNLNVEFIEKKSEEVVKTWKRKIDFIHIDGNHRYVEVVKDLKLWMPYLKKGHYAFFHDYNSDPKLKYGVKRLIDSLGSKYFDEIITNPQVNGFAICRKK